MAERTCSVEGCDRPCRDRLLLCGLHYYRKRTRGTFDAPIHKTGACAECPTLIDTARNRSGLCKQCRRRKHYRDNGDHERRTMADWYRGNTEHKRACWKRYRAEHADELREKSAARVAADPVKYLKIRAEYRERNREQIRKRSNERRRNDPTWPLRNRENQRRRRRVDGKPVNFAAILAEHGMTCHICGDEIPSMTDLHFDHVIPLVKGGSHSAKNIRPAHAVCNLRKGSRIA